jgi:hypothetical protein
VVFEVMFRSVQWLILALATALAASVTVLGFRVWRWAGQVRASGGFCDLSGTSSAEHWIIMHESSGRPAADNPTSTAFGLGQLILANRIRYLGADYATTDCGKQLSAFRMYVADAYGTAETAKAFWQANGWY